MSISVLDLGRAIVQSPYEELLPDGMGLSLPVPVLHREEKCLGLFVYSAHERVAYPPKGLFFLRYPELDQIDYREIAGGDFSPAALPGADPVNGAAAVKTIEDSLGEVLRCFPSETGTEAKQAVRRYREALERLAGEAIRYYESCFPAFFAYADGLG